MKKNYRIKKYESIVVKYRYFNSIILLSVILILSSCNVKDNKNTIITKKDSINIESPDLTEVNSTFKYNGKPINPLFLYEITTNILIEDNALVSIDVSYASTLEKYKNIGNPNNLSEGDEFRKFETYDNYTYSTTWREVENIFDDGSYSYKSGYFNYKWYGKLNNGIHILRTLTNGGGSMDVVNLLFVKFSEQEYFNNGTKEQRLFLTKVSEESFGMPENLNITLDKEKNNVTIHYKDVKDTIKTIQF